jgi:hypothetical protein
MACKSVTRYLGLETVWLRKQPAAQYCVLSSAVHAGDDGRSRAQQQHTPALHIPLTFYGGALGWRGRQS